MKTSLGKNILKNGLYQLGNLLFPLISGAYIARILEPAGVGRVAWARNLVSWFTMLAALGIPAYGIREMARCPEGEKDRLFSELMVLQCLSTLVSLLIYLGYALWLPGPNPLTMVFALELVFHFFSMEWLYQSREDYGYIAIRSLSVKLLSLLAMVVLVRDKTDAVMYGLILCLGTGITGLWNAIHAGSFVRFTLGGLYLRRHIRPVLTLMVSAAAASLYSKLDITMLGLMGTSEQVGYYVNAHKTVSLVLALAASVTAVFLPRLSHVYGRDKQVFARTLSGGLELLLLLAVPGCVGLMLVAEEVTVFLFGAAFAPAGRSIRILALLIPVKGVGDLLCYQALISTGNERYFPAARLAAGLGNVVLNRLMIPAWGHDGAAAASVISELLGNGLLLIPSLRLCRPVPEKGFLRAVAVSTAAMAAAVGEARGWPLLLRIGLGVAVYLAAAALQRKQIFGGRICTILRQKEMK